MRDNFELTETYMQMFFGMFAMALMLQCAGLLGCSGEQKRMLVVTAGWFYILSPLICLVIERCLWEKAGYWLRQFLMVFTVITILICLFFLAVVFSLWLVGLIWA
ncbi:MAG: hypothetical protein LBF88_02105 [Planctomycetaceae bacterium]|jgi:hypothetical protein|nr:hypothetical protein [Planctomycetaceae bacterium]